VNEQQGGEDSAQALSGTVAIPAGGTVPLIFNVRFSLAGYRIGVRGQASFARAREFARAAGIPETSALASLAGEPIAVDLSAQGPWLAPEKIPLEQVFPAQAASASAPESSPPLSASAGATAVPAGDTVTGTVTVRNANWKAGYLASHVAIAEATLHLGDGAFRWDPVDFSYGPIKGTASLTLPADCSTQTSSQPCVVQFQVQFADLDAAALESALLGAREKGTLLSTLIDRLHPSSASPWPRLEGTVSADSLVLGPVTLQEVSATLRILPGGAEITSIDAGLFGGNVHFGGTLTKPATDQDKPAYTLSGDFQNLNAADVGRLLGLRWTGGTLNGNGNLELSGYTDEDLAGSAKGTLHFECRQGSIAAAKTAIAGEAAKPASIPPEVAHFDRWTGDASIANGAIELGQNQVVTGVRKRSAEATITFGDPPTVSFAAPKETHAEKHR
jgi:hypothetical protein